MVSLAPRRALGSASGLGANLRTEIVDFGGRIISVRIILILRANLRKDNLNLKGWNSNVQRTFPGNSESTNLLSRDNISREIGHKGLGTCHIAVRLVHPRCT